MKDPRAAEAARAKRTAWAKNEIVLLAKMSRADKLEAEAVAKASKRAKAKIKTNGLTNNKVAPTGARSSFAACFPATVQLPPVVSNLKSPPLLSASKPHPLSRTKKSAPVLPATKLSCTVDNSSSNPPAPSIHRKILNPYRSHIPSTVLRSSELSSALSDTSSLTTKSSKSSCPRPGPITSDQPNPASQPKTPSPMVSHIFEEAVMYDDIDAKTGGYDEMDCATFTESGYKYALVAWTEFAKLQGSMTGIIFPEIKKLTLDMLKGKSHHSLEVQYVFSRFCTFLTQLKQPSGLYYKSGTLIQYLSGCKTVLDKRFKRFKLFDDVWYGELRTSLKLRLGVAAMKRGESVSDKKVI